MRIKSSPMRKDGTCNEDAYCVRLYSRRGALVNEFCLDKRENDIADIEAAEDLLRQTLAPCNFASTTVSLANGEDTNDETVLQFAP